MRNIISKIVRSKRKSLVLEILPDSSLIVRAPYGAAAGRIMNFVLKKLDWILEKKKVARHRSLAVPVKNFTDGEDFLYLGAPYRLSISECVKEPLSFDVHAGFVLSEERKANGRKLFERWYREKALVVFSERVNHYSRMTGLDYSRIRITGAKRRWGSCSVKNSLNFSWRLVMAPLPIIDYVVAHEVSHLKEKNHSRRFWDRVGSLACDYKASRRWLRENGHMLNI